MVKWKDILTGLWRGPDPVLPWARGSVCGFPQDQQDPVWAPECLVRRIQHGEHLERQHDDSPTPSHDEPAGNGSTKMGYSVGIP